MYTCALYISVIGTYIHLGIIAIICTIGIYHMSVYIYILVSRYNRVYGICENKYSLTCDTLVFFYRC